MSYFPKPPISSYQRPTLNQTRQKLSKIVDYGLLDVVGKVPPFDGHLFHTTFSKSAADFTSNQQPSFSKTPKTTNTI